MDQNRTWNSLSDTNPLPSVSLFLGLKMSDFTKQNFAIKVILSAWVAEHRCCASLPLYSFAEDETICYYEGASLKEKTSNLLRRKCKCSSAAAYTHKNNCSVLLPMISLIDQCFSLNIPSTFIPLQTKRFNFFSHPL